MDAVSANKRSPANLDGLKLTLANQLIELRVPNPERLPRARNGNGKWFHDAVSFYGAAPCRSSDRY
jgi:hypothetical protein